MTDSSVLMSDEELMERDLRRRVRLFNLSPDSSWCERGLGQVAAYYVEKYKGTFLFVISETDDSLLLQSQIHPETMYNKLQGRFIIWSEGNIVFGMSFQETAGCDDVWNTICQVQGNNPSEKITLGIIKEEVEESQVINDQEWLEEMLDIEQVSLSAYERDVLEQLIELVNRLVSPVIEDDIPYTSAEDSKLLDLFHEDEDVVESEYLQQMHEVISYLSSLNKQNQ